MTGLMWALCAITLVLVVVVAGALWWGYRMMSRLAPAVPAGPASGTVPPARRVGRDRPGGAGVPEAASDATGVEAERVAEREAALAARERRLAAAERELSERQAELARQQALLATQQAALMEQQAALVEQRAALADRQARLAEEGERQRRELERLAGLTREQARAEIVAAVEEEAKREAVLLARRLEEEARRTGEQRARRIVADAIQRVAAEQTTESVVSVLHLPSDEMKGRIIGREGRNIRAFESLTGVNLIIDDTPEAVLLSCFDPVRREVARVALERLVTDGRIHPHRIEEAYQSAALEVDELCRRAADDALAEVGILDLHPELVTLLGRLRYRTSYGQNVLRHLVETAHLAGIMAAELGVDARTTRLTRRAAFLHDIGKALTHEADGSHAKVGAELARRYGEPEEVAHAIEAHHNEVEPQTIEAVLTQAADACSGGRPGARRAGLETYISRLARIEEIAGDRPGVAKVFAMQAGREIRVMVRPEEVDDIGAAVLARDVAKRLEEELPLPGQMRVTVIREVRATETVR